MKENLLKKFLGRCASARCHLLALFFLLVSLPALCANFSFKDENFGYSIIDDNSVAIFANNSFSGSVTIPSTVSYNGKTYTVTTIGEKVFSGKSDVVAFILPQTIKKIDSQAFSDCSSLLKINIPESVSDIEEFAFSGCRLLTSMTVPKSMTSLPDGIFSGCSALKT
jgi:hypothetical protein